MVSDFNCMKCGRPIIQTGIGFHLCVVCRDEKLQQRHGKPRGRSPEAMELVSTIDVTVLSPRMRELAERLKLGQTNIAMAEAMGITEGTLKTYVSNLYTRVRAQSAA